MWMVCLLALACAGPARSAARPIDETKVRRLESLIYKPGTMSRIPSTDVSATQAAIEDLLADYRKCGDVWATVTTDRTGQGGRLSVLEVLGRAALLMSEDLSARDEKVKWCRLKWDLYLAALRDPVTQTIYRKELLTGAYTPRTRFVGRLIHWGGLSGARGQLVEVDPDARKHYGALIGARWVDEPDAVVKRDSTTYIDAAVLRPEFDVGRNAGTILIGLRGRTARIPVGRAISRNPRQGWRTDNGRTMIPVVEIERQGLCSATPLPMDRMVAIRPEDDAGDPALARELPDTPEQPSPAKP